MRLHAEVRLLAVKMLSIDQQNISNKIVNKKGLKVTQAKTIPSLAWIGP
jgi:hypothetical protein